MRLGKEDCIRYLLAAVAGSSLLALAGIVLFLFLEGLPLFSTHSPLDFLGGMLWYPTEDPGLFGIFPLLVASLAVTALSSLLAVPLGVMTAVYLNELAPPAARRPRGSPPGAKRSSNSPSPRPPGWATPWFSAFSAWSWSLPFCRTTLGRLPV